MTMRDGYLQAQTTAKKEINQNKNKNKQNIFKK